MFEVSGISVIKLEISPFFFLRDHFCSVEQCHSFRNISFPLVLTYPYETVSLYLHILILAQITDISI